VNFDKQRNLPPKMDAIRHLLDNPSAPLILPVKLTFVKLFYGEASIFL
jgi:hypothetical protein